MANRRHTLLRGLLTAVGGTIVAAAAAAGGGDKRVLPPVVRSFASPSGARVLEVRGTAGWKSPVAQAELWAVEAGSRRSVWTKTLPHRLGPALAIVSDAGQVVMLDEWVKTPSPYAIVLLDPSGNEVARYSMSDIATVSGVPSPKLVAAARSGAWMSAPPRPAVGRPVVLLEAGKVPLELDLVSGRLARSAAPRP